MFYILDASLFIYLFICLLFVFVILNIVSVMQGISHKEKRLISSFSKLLFVVEIILEVMPKASFSPNE